MSKKNDLSKQYLSNNDIFKDLFNYYFFDGNEVIKKDNLVELDTVYNDLNIYKDISERRRDILKDCCIKEDDKNMYIILGIENQTYIDKYMVIRNLFYDALEYEKQRKNIVEVDKDNKNGKIKLGRIKPVITLVIYYGIPKWKAPTSLPELLEINEDNWLYNFIPNYKLNIISLYELNDNDIDKFKSEFKKFAKFIQVSNDYKKIEELKNNKEYNIVSIETAKMINLFTKTNIEITESEGEIDMCKGIDDLKRISKEEGKKEAQVENIKLMHTNGADSSLIAKLLGLDIKKVEEILNN